MSNKPLYAMVPGDVAQLKQLGQSVIGVPHGDVICKTSCQALIEKGYAERTVKFYAATSEGLRWLRCAEIDAPYISGASK